MDISSADNLRIVLNSNREILDYFNDEYVTKLEEVQRLKTEQFELKAKIAELKKTLDVYSFKTSTGHNVFSPFSTETTMQQEKAAQIELQLKDLLDIRITLDEKIEMLEKDINVLKTRIQSISLSVKKMEELVSETTEDTEASEADLTDLEETSDDSPDEENHGLNVLRLIQHNKLELSEQIKKQLQQTLSGNQHKLEVLSWLLKTDTNRAKVTLAEIIASEKNIEQDVNNIVNELSRVPDVSEPIWTLLDDTFLEYKEAHPECVIQTDIDCPDYDIHIDPIITENLLFIIKEIMDNSFKHSNANRITIKIFISGRLIDVYINDNGVGIDTNYKLQAPWYSGLHKIQEIIYLLGGHIKIDGDLISGTNVRFSFPVNEKGQNNEE